MLPARLVKRHVVGFVAMVVWLLGWCPGAFALNPALDVSQYAHTSWKIRDGFSKGSIFTIAQTPDGYLWLGTELGLLRFDGVRPVPWQPPPGEQLPSINIRALLVSHDGTLWIGTDMGLARWKDGKLTRYEPLAGRFFTSIVEDRRGTVWATVFFNRKWTLCEIRGADAECHGDDGGPGIGAIRVFEDRAGRLWVGTVGRTNGLWRWKPGPPKFYPLAQQSNGIRGLSEDRDGALLIFLTGGLSRFVDGESEIAYPLPASVRQLQFSIQLRDRDGGLWAGGSAGGGLVHFHRGMTDTFASPDGLSGEEVYELFEDREGNIWVGTSEGLDRFREVPVARYSVKQGLTSGTVGTVLAARDGSIWMGTSDRLNRWYQGQLTSRWQPKGIASSSIFQDSLERVWASTENEVGYFEDHQFVALKGVGGGLIRGIAEDSDANLWIANSDLGLFRVSIRTAAIELRRWDKLSEKSFPVAMAANRSVRGVWLGFSQGRLAHFADGQVRESYGIAEGVGAGIRSLQLDGDGTLWAATDAGLSRVKNGRVATLTIKDGLPCDGVLWLVEDNDHALWLGARCGLVRIAAADLAAWIASLDMVPNPKPRIKTTVFDNADGVRTYAGLYFSQPAVKASDGRLWFSSPGGVSVVDPRVLNFNSLPPPVRIEQVVADRQTYEADRLVHGDMRLPALTRDLQIHYTALSLVAPEKMQFRYKLEGWDRDWQDVGTRRQAFYANLPPRNYRFRVIASNNSGVWNETGASLDFAVAPAYYQTAWFRIAVVATVLLMFTALHRLRLHVLARQFNMRMEERINERTRIARDLHDTLLQSFQAVLLRTHAITYELQDRPDTRANLETVIEQARHAITEGRDAVQKLRSPAFAGHGLAEAISNVARELSADQRGEDSPEIQLDVEGMPRDLAPLVRDEVYRIVCEALRNAFRHSKARKIEVDLHYDPRQLRLRVRDDGQGMTTSTLNQGARSGHFGLPGMHERAKILGGALIVWSEVGAGTEIELTVPASKAYTNQRKASGVLS